MPLNSRRGRIGLLSALAFVIIAILISYGVRYKRGAGRDKTESNSSAKISKAEKKRKGKGKKEEDPVPVEIAQASLRDISSYYYTTSTIQPEKKVDIVAKISGEISELLVEEGDHVKRGDVLCKLDDEEKRIELQEAEINKEREEKEYKRIKRMHEEKLISDKEYADTKYSYDVARNRLEAARLKYSYTRIKAPFDGVIAKRFIDVGENVSIGKRLFELADTEPLLITLYLPENEIKDIHIGQPLYLTPDNDPNRIIEGEIMRLAPEIDEKTGTVKITAKVHGKAIPGSFVRIRIVKSTHTQTLAIPSRSLINDAGEVFVFVARADTVSKAKVKIGFQDESYSEIVEGLDVGDSVVVVGQGGLRVGKKIKILGWNSKSDSLPDEMNSK